MVEEKYVLAVGYGKVYVGGRTKEIFQGVCITVCDKWLISEFRWREETMDEFVNGVSRKNGLIPINFSWSNTPNTIEQDCGSLNRLETCDKVAVGKAGNAYIVYDINTHMYGRVTKDDIIRNNWCIQNMTISNGAVKVLGGVDKLVKFRPNERISFSLDRNYIDI